MTIRFLEESPGVWSMTRLLALMAAIGGALTMATACAVALISAIKGGDRMLHAAALVGALSGLAIAAFGGSWAQTRERSQADEPAPTVAVPGPPQVTVTTEVGG